MVSSANFMMVLDMCLATQSCVNREFSSGLRTLPCEVPVLRIKVEEMFLPMQSCWGIFVRKSRIQQFMDPFGWDDSVKSRAVIHEQESTKTGIAVFALQVGQGGVKLV